MKKLQHDQINSRATQSATHNSHATRLTDETSRKKLSSFAESSLAVVAAFVIIAALQWNSSLQSEKVSLPANSTSITARNPQTESISPQLNEIPTNLSESLPNTIEARLQARWPESSLEQIDDELLLQASDAVAAQDEHLLADSMTLLGANALRQLDLDSANVYLEEALSVFEEINDTMGIANVEMLRAEINLQKRERARRAAHAYDTAQLAGWKIAKGYFHEAIDELNHVIDENLALDRFGAAAGAYQSLYKGYQKHGQIFEAQQAGIEIVKLHASSGRVLESEAMLRQLQQDGLDTATSAELQRQSLELHQEYQHSVKQISRANDYQQLYHHFIHAGDPVRAWQFRLKSQNSLQGVSRRAMHRRQTGVLALLYTSNDHMKNAERSLNRAGQLYTHHNESDLSATSRQMKERIY